MPPLFVVDRGRGAPVLFVHGQPGLGSDWDQVAGRLGDHRLLVVDRPGYGGSGDETLSLADNAEVLAQLLVERGAVPATVVGHSFGGGIAILLAAHHPELVSGLVLAASVGRVDNATVVDRALAYPVVGEAMSALGLFTLGRVLPPLRALTRGRSQPALRWLRAALPDDSYDVVSSQRGRRIWRSFVAEQRALMHELGDVEGALVQIQAPTVVLSGEWDVVVPPSMSARMADTIARAELVRVAGAGHFLPRDAPGSIAAAVRRVEVEASRASDAERARPERGAGA